MLLANHLVRWYIYYAMGKKATRAIRFMFDHRKTLQAAALLTKREPESIISRMRLLKLLYIADREALAEIGRPITGDRLAAMKKGPVLSGFYDIIKGESVHSRHFETYFWQSGFRVGLRKSPGVGLLNRYEVRKLQDVSERFEKLDDEDLSEITHGFPEWKRHQRGDSSEHIPVEDVLEAVGRAGKAGKVREKAEVAKAIAELWGCPR
jgi:uncharacterized phage-associated protein